MKIFETFESSGQILSNSLCQFWNNESIPSQIFYPSSVSWRITLYTFLAQALYTLLKRSTKKWRLLGLSSAWVKIHLIPHVDFEMTSQFLFKFCIILHFHEKLFLSTFLAQAICTLLQTNPLKWKFLGLLRARVKFCQLPSANFETMSRFLNKFCIPL